MAGGEVPDGAPRRRRRARHQEVYPMQTLRASAVAAPFVILAVVALLGVLIR
jgi:hypothetical protein